MNVCLKREADPPALRIKTSCLTVLSIAGRSIVLDYRLDIGAFIR